MMTYFGFPFVQKNYRTTGFARLYLKSIIKVTEDFVSYDLLRLKLFGKMISKSVSFQYGCRNWRIFWFADRFLTVGSCCCVEIFV